MVAVVTGGAVTVVTGGTVATVTGGAVKTGAVTTGDDTSRCTGAGAAGKDTEEPIYLTAGAISTPPPGITFTLAPRGCIEMLPPPMGIETLPPPMDVAGAA